jgi:hypothetical protein
MFCKRKTERCNEVIENNAETDLTENNTLSLGA